MYITDEDIRDRAILNGMEQYPNTYEQREIATGYMEAAQAELEQEHAWGIYQVWQEAVDALKGLDEPKPEECAWFLMSGMSCMDECVYADGEFFYNEGQITHHEGQWMFDHTQDTVALFDVDLLNGLQVCKDHDQAIAERSKTLAREFRLNPIQLIKFNKLVNAAFREGLDGGLLVAQNVSEEIKLRAVK